MSATLLAEPATQALMTAHQQPIESRFLQSSLPTLCAIGVGAIFLLWPAIWNGYPILYSDTNAFLTQGILGFFVWDKPFVYGPWMALFHWQYSLWMAVIAQSLVVSSILWLTTQCVAAHAYVHASARVDPTDPTHAYAYRKLLVRYLVVCALLGVLSAAPWFTSLLMPDIFAPITVLCLFLLACHSIMSRMVRAWVLLVGTFAIASHLSHLVIAAAVLLVVALFKFRQLKLAILPLLLALLVLVATNWHGFQKLAVSPFGSVFFLARLAADGHINPVLKQQCAQQSLHLCMWQDRLPTDSDDFMWNGKGPVWSHPGGPIGLAPEASALVMAAVMAEPVGVARSLLSNTGRQLFMIGLGDTLHDDHLDVTMGARIAADFPAAELERYRVSRQIMHTLVPSAEVFNTLGRLSVIAGFLLSLYVLYRSWVNKDRVLIVLIVMVWMGLLANAFATGALSKPHYRYQTRISWLLVFVPLIVPFSVRKSTPV